MAKDEKFEGLKQKAKSYSAPKRGACVNGNDG